MANRLNLNFGLETNKERSEFLASYLERPEFQKRPPSEEELETMSNYILWGRDPDTGKNVVQSKEIQIETRNGTWDKQEAESLDALMEGSAFNEATLQRPTQSAQKIPRETFSREDALTRCPDSLRDTFKELFAQIDELDLGINYYDLLHGKRKNPPRPQLLKRFSEEEQFRIRMAASEWSQFKYLKRRHLLVELRRQQFTLRDSFTPTVQRHTPPIVDPDPTVLSFDTEIQCFPLGLKNNSPLAHIIFKDKLELHPGTFTESEISLIINFLWEKRAQDTKNSIDFRNPSHLYGIFKSIDDLEDKALDPTIIENQIGSLIETLQFYIEMAEITEVQREILDLKMKHVCNQDIAFTINKKWGKSYTVNYISTIFHQKILPKIAEAASEHEKIMENLPFPEEFKQCAKCGRIMLRDADHFVRKTRAKDGFSNRCKQCDKADRQSKKEVK